MPLCQICLKEDVTLFFDVNKKKSNAGRNRIIFGKYWLDVWDLYNLICYYWYWLLFDIDLLICWLLFDVDLLLLEYYTHFILFGSYIWRQKYINTMQRVLFLFGARTRVY